MPTATETITDIESQWVARMAETIVLTDEPGVDYYTSKTDRGRVCNEAATDLFGALTGDLNSEGLLRMGMLWALARRQAEEQHDQILAAMTPTLGDSTEPS